VPGCTTCSSARPHRGLLFNGHQTVQLCLVCSRERVCYPADCLVVLALLRLAFRHDSEYSSIRELHIADTHSMAPLSQHA
jgi:hypothetical protein